mgnify:CR=1 FL=1
MKSINKNDIITNKGIISGAFNVVYSKPEIINDIQSTGKLEENNEKSLVQIIEEYKKGKK